MRNYTGGASRTKEAPEMAEVNFWSVHKPWRRYHYVPVDFDSGYKKHFKNFCSIWNKFNEHAFRIGLYLPLDIVVWYIMSQEVEIHKAIKLKDFIDWHNKKEMTVLF